MAEEKPKIIIDEDWKEQAAREKERLAREQQQAAASTGAAASRPAPDSAAAARAEAPPHERPPLPPASLATLTSSLATQALLSLGQVADPATGQAILDLEYARHLIDTLAVLEDKTAGRRTPEESRLLDDVLHDLRMTFVAVQHHLAAAAAQAGERGASAP